MPPISLNDTRRLCIDKELAATREGRKPVQMEAMEMQRKLERSANSSFLNLLENPSDRSGSWNGRVSHSA